MSRAGSRSLLVAAGVAFCLGPTNAVAQLDQRLSLGLSLGYADILTVDEPRKLTGPLFGIQAGASYARFDITAEYRQGWLSAGSEGGPGRRVSSARGALAFRVLPWVAVETGPVLTAVELPQDDRKILRWRIGLSGRAPLVPGLVTGYASAAGSFAGTGLSYLEVPSSGGGEVGLVVRPNQALWARLAYRIDREYLPMGSSQTFQSAFLTVGVSMPRSRDDEEPR